MKILITQYPFFREDFVPAPSEVEKIAYVGLIFEATQFVAEEEMQAHIAFPGGAYQIPIYSFLAELIKLSDELKPLIIPRWLPYLDIAEKEKGNGFGMLIPIAADCCEEIGTVN